MSETEEELKTFLTETIGMDEDEIEERADELFDNDEVLTRVNAFETIKEENQAQPQEEKDIEGAYLGFQTRTNDDGEETAYYTWVFSETEHEVKRIKSDSEIVDSAPPQFTEVTVTNVQEWEDLEDGYTWLEASDDASVDFGDDMALDLVIDYAQPVGEVDEDQTYLVIADIVDVDTLGEFHEETEEYLGRKPVVEDEDTSNIRLVLEDPRTGNQATIKIKDPRYISELTGIDFERLMKISANKDAQEMAQQLRTVLEGEEVTVFARGSAYVNGELVEDGDGNARPWLTLSNFDIGFIESLDELESSE